MTKNTVRTINMNICSKKFNVEIEKQDSLDEKNLLVLPETAASDKSLDFLFAHLNEVAGK